MNLDPFAAAVTALHRLRETLPRVAGAEACGSDAAKEGLRPRYLEVLWAWNSVLQAAQNVGVAVTRRKSGAAQDAS